MDRHARSQWDRLIPIPVYEGTFVFVYFYSLWNSRTLIVVGLFCPVSPRAQCDIYGFFGPCVAGALKPPLLLYKRDTHTHYQGTKCSSQEEAVSGRCATPSRTASSSSSGYKSTWITHIISDAPVYTWDMKFLFCNKIRRIHPNLQY